MTMCLLSCDTKPTGSLRPCIICGLTDMFPFFKTKIVRFWCLTKSPLCGSCCAKQTQLRAPH